jgi:hypothetical protein
MTADFTLKGEYSYKFNFSDVAKEIKGKLIRMKDDQLLIKIPKEEIASVEIESLRESTPELIVKEKISSEKEAQKDLNEAFILKSEADQRGGIEQLQEEVSSLDKNAKQKIETADSSRLGASTKAVSVEHLLEEEMGRVKGSVFWKGAPLADGKVMAVLEKYTGFSFAGVKQMYAGGEAMSSDGQISLTTQTDSEGRYVFSKIPPGQYRFYWTPAGEVSWFRRLRDKPDFEVLPGKLTVQNIPGTKK